MKKTNFFMGALVLLSQFFIGCSENEIELPDQNQSHLSSTELLDKTTSARGSESSTSPFFPLFQLFLAKTNAECDAKVNEMIDHFFNQSNNDRIYYESGNNEAYILDTGNDDVRSEGMSYGMMITVQLDMKEEFDRLWNFARNHMLHTSGQNQGYFKWQVGTNGSEIDPNPAPDGEEYFAMSLYFAYNRWGNITYKQAADDILDAMLNNNGIGPLIRSNNLICFSPWESPDNLTDPSYHLPAFYELFAEYSGNNRWRDIATASRQYLRNTAVKSPYGLVPDYSDYNGNPATMNAGDGHDAFRFDAWRTVMNITLDICWSDNPYPDYGNWPASSRLTNQGLFTVEYHLKFLQFFEDQGISSHGNQFDMNGNELGSDHSPGLVAMNAVGARAVYNWDTAKNHAEEFWSTPLPSGEHRYYDGCLYMFGMLFSTGNYNIIDPGNQIRPFSLQIPGEGLNYGVVNFKSSWSGKVLTATANQNDADIKAQPNNDSWTSQDWEIEPIEGSNNVRLKNKWAGKYLNVQNQNENAKVVCYELHEDWLSMQWSMEPVAGNSEQVRLKNAWSGKYLTVETNGDYANIWAQSLNTSWPSQKWIVE